MPTVPLLLLGHHPLNLFRRDRLLDNCAREKLWTFQHLRISENQIHGIFLLGELASTKQPSILTSRTRLTVSNDSNIIKVIDVMELFQFF